MERFTISLDHRLAHQFDAWMAARGYANRSEAVRDLLRAELGRPKPDAPAAGDCVACLSYVFAHHARDLAERLTAIQHEHHELTASTMHVHLDHEHCLETVILRGPTARVVQAADRICAETGVHHGRLNLIAVERHEPHGEHVPHAPPAPAGRRSKRRADAPESAGHLHFKPAA